MNNIHPLLPAAAPLARGGGGEDQGPENIT